ncbi:ngoFVII restriction endonuclease family protein [Burkholderia pseudomallei MSHR983]|uniref:phospholipase D family protein n=1 Tax=Burkholderia pseudomallei TaxID=28450 RepID=UPI000538A7DE|nr:phospholipase D family protein [Burkholderia pseudomallei]KGU65829.1 ngoFVII restriction endonuclease family protein [Burkholderia pseudomallei MSHR983]
MRYHDTGSKDAGQALATWFEQVLTDDITELRIQSGYFTFDAIRAISTFLKGAIDKDLRVHLVLGSNDGDTLHSDVSRLALKLGLPRSNARLAIVNFGNALFHPKVYHVTRADGHEASFVGSANFTAPGLTGSNVEAALSVDTRDGDAHELLIQIRTAIDKWFDATSGDGVAMVHSQADIDSLLELGILAQARPPRSQGANGGDSSSTARRAKRQKLVKLPPWPDAEEEAEADEADEAEPVTVEAGTDATFDQGSNGEAAGTVAEPPGTYGDEGGGTAPDELDLLPVEQRAGFPDYLFFEPGATRPTSGWAAMSGQRLQEPFIGLILRLTKDSARHFSGGDGTANISIPVAVIRTFRFGVFEKSGRPRAEFGLFLRYYSDTLVVEREANTNVMAYGFMAGETGHGDLRMVLPAAVKRIASELNQQGQRVPREGDLFLLEWPNSETDSFGLTFLDPQSSVAEQARTLFQQAVDSGTLDGGACGLPPGLSPTW